MNATAIASKFYPRSPGLPFNTLTVGGNWGTLTVDKVTGRVLHLEERDSDWLNEEGECLDSDGDPKGAGYRDIVKVDLNEFYSAYPADPSERLDILDVGFWFTDGFGGVGYQEPEHDWRQNVFAYTAPAAIHL